MSVSASGVHMSGLFILPPGLSASLLSSASGMHVPRSSALSTSDMSIPGSSALLSLSGCLLVPRLSALSLSGCLLVLGLSLPELFPPFANGLSPQTLTSVLGKQRLG